MWENIKVKIKSPVVWTAVIAQVCVILGLFLPDVTDTIKIIGASVVEIATLFGVLNNPNNREGF